MRAAGALLVAGMLLLPQAHEAEPAKSAAAFLIAVPSSSQWCAYNDETAWAAATRETGAMIVGKLVYSGGMLREIDVTETDESGDWTAYDRYYLNSLGKIIRLSRLINVLPGDRSVSTTFSVRRGKAAKTATTEKQLSTGKQLPSPTAVWLPDLPIRVLPSQFPFAGLLGRTDLPARAKFCVDATTARE